MYKRWIVLIVAVIGVLLVVNAAVSKHISRAAEPFGGGRVLELAGPDLNVDDHGPRGDHAVVLLHGYSASIQWWDAVAPVLARNERVITIDLVGHGGSEAPSDPAPYSAEGQATAVSQALDALGVRHAVLVGHSMGGVVATALAEREPNLVDRVVVSDTPAGPGLTALPVLGKVVCWPVLGAAFDGLRHFDVVDTNSLQTGFAADFPVPVFAYESLKRMTHNALCNARLAGRLNEEKAVSDRLAGLGKPVRVVFGERDVLTPTESNIARYRQSGLQPVVIAGAGHSPAVEKPGEFLSAIDTFVSAASLGRPSLPSGTTR